MAETIELLERIGQDANLRYASTDELSRLLVQAGFSAACTTAVICGDTSLLARELGQPSMPVFHHSIDPGHEEQQREEREDEQREQREQGEQQPDENAPSPD